MKVLLPHDDPVARFMASMSHARNDIELGLHLATEATEQDRPEAGYLQRVTAGHLFEALRSLAVWRQVPAVRQLLEELDGDGAEILKQVASTEQSIGADALKQSRASTFHYACPDGKYGEDNSDRALASIHRFGGRFRPVGGVE